MMRATSPSRRLPAAAVFSGSFLLFMIQPMLGRTLLPVFGGSAAVWSVCLGAYQVLLLAGYAYAHLLAGKSALAQRVAHLALLGVALAWAVGAAALRLPVKDLLGHSQAPAFEVLLGVLLFVGLPYVLLASGSTLVQAWVAGADGSGAAGGATEASGGPAPRSVYSLYAVSNLGSLLGLLAYPFVLEPFVPLTAQWYGFAAGLALYTLLIAQVGAGAGLASPPSAERCPSGPVLCPPPSALWFCLPAVSAFLLNAVIAHLFIDVTPMPLVWVVMLAVFLLSYVVGFSRFGEGRRVLWGLLSLAALAGAAVTNGMWGTGSFYPNAAAAVALVFCMGVLLHGWLYAERPDPARLTRFYLAVAAGGAAGGLLSSLVAPLVFNRVLEYPLILLVCALLAAWRLPKPARVARSRRAGCAYLACWGAAWLALAWATARHTQSRVVFRARNFYGSLAVTQTFETFGARGAVPVHYLWFGQTTHGIQVRAPELKDKGTAYFGPTGGGIAFHAHPLYRRGAPMKVGVVGLGAGTLACYGRAGDLFRFFEINPQVERVATDPRLFTYLPDAKMRIDLVPGDARRMLEKERAAGDPLYDLLMIDAYSGDAVPYHLATSEAFRLYFDRLAPEGLLAVHVSNWHIDLLPLCKAVAAEQGVHPYGVVGVAQDSVTAGAVWVFMTRQPMTYRYPGKGSVREVVWSQIRDVAAPTDEKGSLISLLRF